MTIIQQLPQKIDSNVTVNVPPKIHIDYVINRGWTIKIGSEFITENAVYSSLTHPQTLYFNDVADALDWLTERHLIVTKAYKELDKAVKKVAKSKPKSTTE